MKRSALLRLLGAATTWAAALPAFADNMTLGEISQAAARSGDKSRQALITIYGNVVNNPLATGGADGSDTILAGIFQVANGALLVIGALFACYVMFRKVSQTAHDGAVFDREKHTMWGPIRIVWGLAALVPTANGWSLSQLLMLWSASVMGIGVANIGVDAAVAAFNDGKGMVLQPVMPSTNALAHKIFEIELCRHGLNASLAMASSGGGLLPEDSYMQTQATDTGFVLANKSFVCGGANVDPDLASQPSSTSWLSSTIDVAEVRRAHLQALSSMEKSLSESARQFVNAVTIRTTSGGSTLPDAEIAIQSAAQQYENTVNSMAATKQGNIGELASQLSSSIKEGGWWTLGQWYQTFAAANTKLSDAVAGKATTFSASISGDPGMMTVYTMALNAYQAQQGRATTMHATPLGTQRQDDGGNILAKLFSSPGQALTEAITNINDGGESRGQINPLIKMKNLGDHLTGVAEIGLAGYLTAKGLEKTSESFSIAGLASRVADASGAISFIKGALDGAGPIIMMIIIAALLLGLGLSTYLPMVPFVIWFGAAVNWLVVVGEGVIAAPLWAITHLGGEGDGFGHKTAHGYIFLLEMMVRPVLMVIGFFLGGAGIIAGGTLLNEGFGIALANAQFDSLTGIGSILAYCTIYFSMCLNLVHSCFNLIFLVPDKVINWVGGVAPAMIGGDHSERTKTALNTMLAKFDIRPSGGGGRRPLGGTNPSSKPDGVRE
ncbi:conjugal transfer/type IV secretion DotA/TraY family protein [Burkholderia pseudomallei]|nr:conjugal transfer/type IV secretion DotA/TraY family protein [Burkholderia pseudomallei]CAJ3785755.1 conjugal transfer/type IV secretion DotA/TraY family protein [Burkholderia pseudomallei]CAJ4038866.1 conjugal transfer/type IV secretion DotA/TraY family protein [Burkholderia pseudomallei]CAJ4523685.1 conjugal transfer/type IV secretion DotA/TraY family protein [Burkholderia pseudomallei]CAJ5885736.1 conjugal transfer/type IV secretion DotA/TraY family protein [Burkholderia pseudomallei]